jgi:hypothetical protein
MTSSIVIPTPSGFPAIKFATGQLDSNAQYILTPMVGPFPEPQPTPYYVAAPGGSVFSPKPSSVSASFSSLDGHGSFSIMQLYPSNQLVYTLNRTGGTLTKGGGADSFFDFADAPAGMTLANDIVLQFSARVSQASVDYNPLYPNAGASGVVLAQTFLGAVLSFNDILDVASYDPSMPSLVVFIQFALLESNGNFGNYRTICVLSKNRAQIISGRLVPNTSPLPFAASSWKNYKFDLNSELAYLLAQAFPADNAWNGVGYTLPSICSQRLDKWLLKNLYIGSELENALPGGASEGSVSLGIQLTWPNNEPVAIRSPVAWPFVPGISDGVPPGVTITPLSQLPGI